jgi:ABC-type branched-subunit amino acid transport system substrate-binding protein
MGARSPWLTSRQYLVGALLTLQAFAVPAVAADPGVTDKEIVIGQNITLQGGRNDYGTAVQGGIRVYLDRVNAAGGVHGRKVVLRTLDDDNKSSNAEANARTLLRDNAFVLFGSIEGGPSTAVMKVAQEAGVPFIGPMAGAPSLRRPHQPMVFPVRAEHREEFRALMSWGKSIGLKTVGFFHAEGANGLEHLNNVKLLAKELGMEVVLPLEFKPDANDAQLDAFVGRILQARPDLMFNHGSAGLYGRLIAKARAAGTRTTFTAVNSGSSQLANALGALAHGMVFAQVVPSPWERKHEITREYQDAMLRADPTARFSYGSLEGYMTAKTLVIALRSAGREPSRAALVRALEGGAIDLGGIKLVYSAAEHQGSRFVDLSMVARDGRFVH